MRESVSIYRFIEQNIIIWMVSNVGHVHRTQNNEVSGYAIWNVKYI